MTNMRISSEDASTTRKAISFTFDGKHYTGYEGDTLASALLANNIHLVGRSFKYHRPRGIMAAGAEEPNALVELGVGARVEPNLKATQIELYEGLVARSQNRFPSLGFDIGEINSVLSKLFPAGFYYKTFMWPASMWMTYEHVIRHAAGLGKVAKDPNDPDTYDKRHAHFDIVIAGGGVTGIMAALAAAPSGQRIALLEETSEYGGWMLSTPDRMIDGMAVSDWIAASVKTLATYDNVTLLSRTSLFGYGDHNHLLAVERVTDHMAHPPAHLPRQRLWKLRARQVILATGAFERPLVFSGNDRPGVMLASACQTYLKRYGVLCGRRAVLVTNNDEAYETAFDMQQAGCLVRAIIDVRQSVKPALRKRAAEAGISLKTGHTVTSTSGHKKLARITTAPVSEQGEVQSSQSEYLDCDLVMMSGGISPVVHLHSQARGTLKWDERSHCFRPDKTHEAEVSIGACNGKFDLSAGLKDAVTAALRITHLNDSSLDKSAERADELTPDTDMRRTGWASEPVWHLPNGLPPGQGGKAFVDWQNDVTASDIQLAAREGFHSVEHVKRYTTTGMATDQGKTSNINALGILSDTLGKAVPEIGTTTFRMPFSPTSIGAIAGRDIKGLFDPVRTTRMDSWHRAHGAEFEHVGQWMRAWYYPQAGEDMHTAVNREVKAARTTAGLLDASTLGKIDVKGPDAAEFLNRVYTNGWSQLGIGKCRYGLMLKDDGMVMDDGVTTRLADDHFHMTTTTGGAAGVLDWLEEWLQTEWPELDVYLTSVTEQWSVATLSGPKARAILDAAGTDIDFDQFPHMSMKDGHINGLPARLFRVSFTGEASYEINVPARYGLALWTTLMKAGEAFGITPYGTEAMHVLRAEKGFIIVGQETDGTVTPHDLGMNWIVSKKKPDFIGKRALARLSMAEPDRKQLVGLRTADPSRVIPEGAHAVLDPNAPLPMPMLGHVTSSYYSPNLGHSIAMALLKGGHQMMGQTVYIPMLDGSDPIEATITSTVFYDPNGDRLNATE